MAKKLGRSTKAAQTSFRARKEPAGAGIQSRNAGGVGTPQSGNTGIARGDFAMPTKLQPPVGGASPTPPPSTGDVPTAQPPEIAEPPDVGSEVAPPTLDTPPAPTDLAGAVSDFTAGRGGSAPVAPPVENTATQAGPQTSPTAGPVQEVQELERDPALDLMLRRYKGGAG